MKFVPLRVETDPLHSLRASSLFKQPTNAGTPYSPVAKLGFSVKFIIQGIGTNAVTDEFILEASKGELTATIRDF